MKKGVVNAGLLGIVLVASSARKLFVINIFGEDNSMILWTSTIESGTFVKNVDPSSSILR